MNNSNRKTKDIRLKKSLGQNFLQDQNIINKIIAVANVNNQEHVIEIGPGAGALTEFLIQDAGRLTCIEIDQRLITNLNNLYGDQEKFKLINEDFLNIQNEDLNFEDRVNNKVVANLPYYITTPIITKILLRMENISEIYVMVQKEVAQRITSEHGNKAYNSLSVFCQTLCETKYEFTVSKESFKPVPKVDSAIISLKRRSDVKIDIYKYEKFVQNCFKQKRKTLVNNLQTAYKLDKETIIKFLNDNDLQANVRAEQISIDKFAQIYNNFLLIIK